MRTLFMLVAIGTFAAGCDANPTGYFGPRGTISVYAGTEGNDIDPDGFTVRIGSVAPVPIAAGDTVFFAGLPAGDHTVTLGDLSPNCTASAPNPRTVSVAARRAAPDTARTAFMVTCVAIPGTLRITAHTTGVELDPDGYGVAIEERPDLVLPSNGSVTTTLLSGGHVVQLVGIAPNCTVSGSNPRSATVVANATVDVTFDVVCAATTSIEVSTSTTGTDEDTNGYRIQAVSANASAAGDVAANASVTLGPLPAGTYAVSLLDLAVNCEVDGPHTRTIVTTSGAAQVAFAVTCTSLGTMAYTAGTFENPDIFTAKTDGSGVMRLTTALGSDMEPSWAPSGRIAFRSSRDGNAEIYVMNADGTAQTRLTDNTAADYAPTWSPDGTRIAFVSDRDGNAEIYVMNADGSNVVRVTNDPLTDLDPAWSPDGTKIAFQRGACDYYLCYGDIHVVGPDGQGLTKLTTGATAGLPAWSPDGTKIAFSQLNNCPYGGYYACERDLYVMSADGTQVMALPHDALDESDIDWSPSGSRMLVAIASCDYYGCAYSGIRAIRPDGSDPVLIIPGFAINPVWRR